MRPLAIRRGVQDLELTSAKRSSTRSSLALSPTLPRSRWKLDACHARASRETDPGGPASISTSWHALATRLAHEPRAHQTEHRAERDRFEPPYHSSGCCVR